MKKIFYLIIASIFLFSAGGVFAQQDQPELVSGDLGEIVSNIEPMIIASVDAYSPYFTQRDGSKYVVFQLKNHIGVQSDIRYAVMLTKPTREGEMFMHQYEYDEHIVLQEGEIVEKIVPYTTPTSFDILPGYKFWLVVKNNAGTLLSMVPFVEEEEVTPVNLNDEYVEISSCTAFENDIERTIGISGLLVVGGTESTIIKCESLDSFLEASELTPRLEIYSKSVFGGQVLSNIVNEASFLSEPDGGDTSFSFNLPHIEEGGLKEVRLSVVDESGNVVSNQFIFSYVLEGGDATFSARNLVLDSLSYEQGGQLKGKLFWMRDVPVGVNGLSSLLLSDISMVGEQEEIIVSVDVRDGKGVECGESIEGVYSVSGNVGSVDFTVAIDKKCNNPVVTTLMSDISGKNIFDQEQFTFANTTGPQKGIGKIILSIIATLVFVVLIFVTRRKRMGSGGGDDVAMRTLLILLFVGAFVLMPVKDIHAWTWTLGDGSTFTFTTDKSAYIPSELITVNSALSSSSCAGAVYPDYVWFSAGMDLSDVSQISGTEYLLRCPDSGGNIIQTGSNAFWAPSGIGAHWLQLYAGVNRYGGCSSSPMSCWSAMVNNGRAYFDVVTPLLAPSISPPEGSYVNPIEVTITTNEPGATTHYTVGGGTPTESSALYTAPFTVSTTNTVRAVSFKPGDLKSDVVFSRYSIGTPPNTPTILSGSMNCGDGALEFSWSSEIIPGDGFYRVYRCTGATCTPFAPAPGPNTTNDTFFSNDTFVSPDIIYSYRVRAYDQITSLWSGYSNIITLGPLTSCGSTQCSDGDNNDPLQDGFTDYPDDPGCTDANDDSELSPPGTPLPECGDGYDNDGDGYTDYTGDATGDPACTGPSDFPEGKGPTVSLTATPNSVTAGNTVEVSWVVSNPDIWTASVPSDKFFTRLIKKAYAAVGSPFWLGSLTCTTTGGAGTWAGVAVESLTGSITSSPINSDTTFNLSCSNPFGGATADAVTVTLTAPAACNYNGVCDPGETLSNCAADCFKIREF